MIKNKQLYRSSFKINIDHFDRIIYCQFFAYNDEDAISQLVIRVQERIGFITTNIKSIILTKNNNEIRKFINLEELQQENTKA
ncbi:MAG: hypothetical protein J6M39_06690 [Lachnospiraceae bacterium]|nr:hypothetical protein [Lachnospiraceae bacterium]